MNSNFYLSSDNPLVSKTSNGFGANAGVFMKSNITNNLAFQVELLGQYRNADFSILGKEQTMNTEKYDLCDADFNSDVENNWKGQTTSHIFFYFCNTK